MSGALSNRTEITPELSEAGIFLENVHQIVGKPFTFRTYRHLQHDSSSEERQFLWGMILGVQLRASGPGNRLQICLQISFSTIDIVEMTTKVNGDLLCIVRTRGVKRLSLWMNPGVKGYGWTLELHPTPTVEDPGRERYNEVLSISGILFIGYCYFGGIEFLKEGTLIERRRGDDA